MKFKKIISVLACASLLNLYNCATKKTKISETDWKPVRQYEEEISAKRVEGKVGMYSLEAKLVDDALKIHTTKNEYQANYDLAIFEKKIDYEREVKYGWREFDSKEFAWKAPALAVLPFAQAYVYSNWYPKPEGGELKSEYEKKVEDVRNQASLWWALTALAIGGAVAWSYDKLNDTKIETKTESAGKVEKIVNVKYGKLLQTLPVDNVPIQASLICYNNGGVYWYENKETSSDPNGQSTIKFTHLKNFGKNKEELTKTEAYQRVEKEYSKIVADSMLNELVQLNCEIEVKANFNPKKGEKIEKDKKTIEFYGYTFKQQILNELLK